MAALRQDADDLAVGELREAYGAIDQLGATPGGGRGVEGERGEREESLLLDALVGRCVGRRSGGGGAGGAEAGAARDKSEAGEAEGSAEEDHEDDDDVGVEGDGGARWLRREEEEPRRRPHRVVDRDQLEDEENGKLCFYSGNIMRPISALLFMKINKKSRLTCAKRVD